MIRLQQGLILALGVVLLIAMGALGLWQMQAFRDTGADSMAARAAAAPVNLTDAFADGALVTDFYGRQVTIEGTYIDKSLYVGVDQPRLVLGGMTTVQGTVAVVRGTATGEGSSLGQVPNGPIQQTGVLMPGEISASDKAAWPDNTLASVNLALLAQDWPVPMFPAYITLLPNESTAQGLEPASVQLPEAQGEERNRGYALQWWVFGAFAMAMCVVWARQWGRGRQPGTP